MTLSNQQRVDRCEQAVTAYSDDEPYANLVDLLSDAFHWGCNRVSVTAFEAVGKLG